MDSQTKKNIEITLGMSLEEYYALSEEEQTAWTKKRHKELAKKSKVKGETFEQSQDRVKKMTNNILGR